MSKKQLVRAVVNSEISVNACALDISAVAVKVYCRVLKVAYGDAEAEERSGAVSMQLLQPFKISLIENNCLQFIPYAVKKHLRPAVKYVFWSKHIYQTRHGALLQALIDGKAVNAIKRVLLVLHCP